MAKERITPLQLFILGYVAGRRYPSHSGTIREAAQRDLYDQPRAWASPAVCSAVNRCLKNLVSKDYLKAMPIQSYYSGVAHSTYHIADKGLALLRERGLLTVNGDPRHPLYRRQEH